MCETTCKCNPKFLGYNVLSPQPALMSASLFSVSNLKPHHLNMENMRNKHVLSQLNEKRLTEKAPWQRTKEQLWKKNQKNITEGICSRCLHLHTTQILPGHHGPQKQRSYKTLLPVLFNFTLLPMKMIIPF